MDTSSSGRQGYSRNDPSSASLNDSASLFDYAYMTEGASYISEARTDSPNIGIRVVWHTFVKGVPASEIDNVKNVFLDALKPVRQEFVLERLRNGHETQEHSHWDKNGFSVLTFHADADPRISPSGIRVIILTPEFINQTWKKYIPEMMHALREIYQYRKSFNKCTPLHVQISLGGRPFPALDLEKISQAAVLLEGQISAHHPSPHGVQYQLCREGKYLNQFPTLSEKVQEIARQSWYYSNQGLMLLMNPTTGGCTGGCPEGFTGPFESIVRRRGGPIPKDENYGIYFLYNERFHVIEFRQASGTLDAEWTLDWIERVILFTTQAIKTPGSSLLGWAIDGIPSRAIYSKFGIEVPICECPDGFRNSRRE